MRTPRLLSMLLALAPLALNACGDESTGPEEIAELAVVRGSAFALLGRPLQVHPVIELRSRGGDALDLPGVVVTATVSSGSLSGTTSVETDEHGQAVFSDLSVDGEPGMVELSFSCCGARAVSHELNLALGDITIHRLVGEQLTGQAGHAPPVAPKVRVDDERGRPLAGTPVRFSTQHTPDIVVTTDEEGVAEFAGLVLEETPGTFHVTATHVGTGAEVRFEVTGVTYGSTTVVRDDTMHVVVVGDAVQLPRLHVVRDGVPVTGAKVRYRVVQGDGVLSADSVYTTDGSHEPVTITSTSRGVTAVEYYAVGYSGRRDAFLTWVVPPVALAFPDPCAAHCPAQEFAVPANIDIDVGFALEVRDAVGVVPGFPLTVAEHGEAGVLWVDSPVWPYEIEPGMPVGGGDGSGYPIFYWAVSKSAGTHSFTVTGQRIAQPWTFTATRSAP